MASLRSTLWTIILVLGLFFTVTVVTLGWSWWTHRAIAQDMAQAEARLAEGKPQEAELVLAERLDQDRPTGTWVDHALELRFRALQQLADKATDPKQKAQYDATAQTLADRVLDPKKPWVKKGQPAWARAHLVLSQAALNADKPEAAQPHIDAILDKTLPEGMPGREEATLHLCRIKMAANDVSGAQKDLDQLLASVPADSPVRPGVMKALGLCNMAMLRSLDIGPNDELYVLQKGDTLEGLKKKFKISPEVLMAINQISDPKRLTIGRRLKIPHLQLSIVVNKADNTLTLYNHGKFFKQYRVRTGKQAYMTPVGDFRINKKMVDPPWRNPKDGKNYAGGEAGNELGCRWLGFQGDNLGIHEASDPNSIGQAASNGCVGMLKEDVIELYDLVPVGTPVKIIDNKAGAPVILPAAALASPGAETGEEAAAAGEAIPAVPDGKAKAGAGAKKAPGKAKSPSKAKTGKTGTKSKKVT